jgi:hypothetical protein
MPEPAPNTPWMGTHSTHTVERRLHEERLSDLSAATAASDGL